MSIICPIWADWFLTICTNLTTIACDIIKLTHLFSFLYVRTCNSAYSIHPIFRYYDFIKDFWLINALFLRLRLPLKWTRRSKVLAQKKRDVSPCIYHSLWRGVQNVILRLEHAVRWYFSNIHWKYCGGHRVALVPIPTWYKWFQQIAILIQRNSCVHGWAPLYIKCSDLHQIVFLMNVPLGIPKYRHYEST